MSKKNAIVKKNENQLLVTVVPPSEEMDLGKQIDHFQEIVKQTASIGCTAAVINGVLLVKAQIKHPKTFVEWLEANTSVSQRTSYNYINAAKRTMGSQIVEELAQRGTMEIAEKVQAAMVKLRLESKPLTELYCDVGIVKKTPSKMGGKREGSGRPTKEQLQARLRQQEEELGADSIQKRVADLFAAAVTGGGLGNCDDKELASAVDMLKKIVKCGEEILKSRKAK